ncbi:lysis protein [Pseudomonas typographi]|uniref:lysis protein n=1 Tax=Pseudomonas typographi TaxID=2715964 RepID=UPI0019342B38|nr:lysis protein [Pseudomonas typographi]
MTETQLKWLGYGGALLLAIALGFAAAWFWQANAYKAKLAGQDAAHQSDLTTIANAAAAQSRTALEKQQQAEQALADLDTKRTKEKADALAENERLRRDVADGNRRLHVAGTCRSGGGNVPQASSTTSLGDAGTVELAPTAGRNVFDIRAGIIADQAALKTLQDYINTSCR